MRDLISPIFFSDNTELHNLIRSRLILPYLTVSFHSSFIEEYAGGLLMALQKPDGGIRPILCGEVWRRCFGRLTVNDTPIRNEEAKLFTSSCDNFIQTAGIREGSSHCVIPIVNTLSNLFGYFKTMRTCHSKLRYFDWDGQVHLAKDKTGGQPGDPLEMLIFNLTIYHLGTGIT